MVATEELREFDIAMGERMMEKRPQARDICASHIGRDGKSFEEENKKNLMKNSKREIRFYSISDSNHFKIMQQA